jgi:ASCH domain
VRALTVKQPWAWAIARGIKAIENRTWSTAFRGELLIHAGVARDQLGLLSAPEEELVFGRAVCIVDLIDCVPLESVQTDPFAIGPICWVLRNPRPVTSDIVRGKLGLWEFPSELITLV